MENERQRTTARQEQDIDPRAYVLTTGFFGGLFASGFMYLAHFLNFIPYGPGVIWQNFLAHQLTGWLRGPAGHVLGIFVIGFISIITAFIYYFLLRRFLTPWAGVLYGIAVWVLIFLGVNELIPGTKPIAELGWNTNITFICIFIFYGLFIGYSISYEFNDKIG